MDTIGNTRHAPKSGPPTLNLSLQARGGIVTIPPKRWVPLNRTSSTETVPTRQQVGLFSLPYELRYQIYELLIPISDAVYSCNDPTRGRKGSKHPLTQLQTLLLVCKRMNEYEPIKEIFYKHHTFVVENFSPQQQYEVPRRPSSATLNHLTTRRPERYFLDKFSWTNTMSQMRKMVFRLAPPGTITGVGSTVISTEYMPNVDFEHHEGWKRTLRNLTVLGLHIFNPGGAENFGFAEWLFKTLWSLVGALHGPKTHTAQQINNSSGLSYPWGNGQALSATLPPGPSIVVYIEGGNEYGSSERTQKARDIVNSIIPKDRFRYVSCPEAMDTPFLDRKRVTAAWGNGESQDLDQGLVKNALDEFFAERTALA
ncbi:hypothetical protein V8F20_006417 [Naviculisporaceae sp. PSN 640]